jgi:hypothetical protein
MHHNYSSCGCTDSTLPTSCATTTRHPAARALHQPCRAPRLLVTRSHELYLNPTISRGYSSLDCSGSTSTTPRVRVPRHVARLVTRLVALLVVDYSASPRLVVDYSTARPGASARRAARHAAHRAARRRLLDRASGCLGTSRGSSSTTLPHPGSSSTTPPRVRVPRHVARLVAWLVAPLIVDYFVSTACPVASARRAARHAARRAARHQLLCLA